MKTVDIYKLGDTAFASLLDDMLSGDAANAGAPYVFSAEARTQLETDSAAWKSILIRVNSADSSRDEAKQTRDDSARTFRAAVRPAREWVKGAFEHGDQRPGEYGLAAMPPRSLNDMLDYGRTLVHQNTQEPPLDPALPEWLLTSIQEAFAALENGIEAYKSARAAHRQAVSDRKSLRDEIEGRVRGLRQHLLIYVGRDDSVLVGYGLVL